MSYVVPDEGVYRGVVTGWEFSKSSKAETPQLVLRVRVDAKAIHDDAISAGFGDLEEPMTKKVCEYITRNTAERVRDDLRTLGYPGTNFPFDLVPDHPTAFDFGDKEIQLRCKHEEYQNRLTDKWSISRAKPGKPLGEEEMLQLAEIYGDTFRAQEPVAAE